jgi:hypothetical protein
MCIYVCLSREASSVSASEVIPSIAWNAKVDHPVQKRPLLARNFIHRYPVYSLPSSLRSVLILSSRLRQYIRNGIFSSVVKFEAFTAVTMKNVVFWDVALCTSC